MDVFWEYQEDALVHGRLLSQQQSLSVDGVLITLYTNLGIFGFLVLVFESHRVYKQIYLKRLQPRFLDSGRAPPEPPEYIFGWLVPLYDMSEDDVKHKVGLDAYMLLRYLGLCLKLSVFYTVWGLVVLVPLFGTIKNNNPIALASPSYGWDKYTLSNVMTGEKEYRLRLWVVAIFGYVFSAYFCQLLYQEYRDFSEYRLTYLVCVADAEHNSDPDIPPQKYFTVMIERIPGHLRSAEKLHNFFNKIFPGDVYNVEIALDIRELDALCAQRRRMRHLLELAVAHYEATNERPTVYIQTAAPDLFETEEEHRKRVNHADQEGGFLQQLTAPEEYGFEKLDSICYYANKLNELNDSVTELQTLKNKMAREVDSDMQRRLASRHDTRAAALIENATKNIVPSNFRLEQFFFGESKDDNVTTAARVEMKRLRKDIRTNEKRARAMSVASARSADSIGKGRSAGSGLWDKAISAIISNKESLQEEGQPEDSPTRRISADPMSPGTWIDTQRDAMRSRRGSDTNAGGGGGDTIDAAEVDASVLLVADTDTMDASEEEGSSRLVDASVAEGASPGKFGMCNMEGDSVLGDWARSIDTRAVDDSNKSNDSISIKYTSSSLKEEFARRLSGVSTVELSDSLATMESGKASPAKASQSLKKDSPKKRSGKKAPATGADGDSGMLDFSYDTALDAARGLTALGGRKLGHLTKDVLKQTRIAGEGAWKGLVEVERAFEMVSLGAFTKYSTTAFVTFNSRVTENISHQMLLSHETLEISHAPNPKDVIWDNVAIPKSQIMMRHFIINVLLTVSSIFWSQLVTSVTDIVHVFHLPSDQEEFLSVLVILAFLLILPWIFDALARYYEGFKLESEIQNTIMTRYFYYQLVNIYVTIGTGGMNIWEQMMLILKDPQVLVNILGGSIPSVSLYFCSLLIVKVLVAIPFEMIRFWQLSTVLIMNNVMDRRKTVRRDLRTGVFYAWPMLYGWIYPQLLMVLMIMVTYACIAPLIMPICVLFFMMAYVMYKYQLLYVYINEEQTGGFMWYAVFKRSLISLLFAMVTLMGYLSLQLRASYYAAGPFYFILPLPFCILYFWRLCQHKFEKASMNLNFAFAMELDHRDQARRSCGQPVPHDTFSRECYRQPSLINPPVYPEPYRLLPGGSPAGPGLRVRASSIDVYNLLDETEMDDSLLKQYFEEYVVPLAAAAPLRPAQPAAKVAETKAPAACAKKGGAKPSPNSRPGLAKSGGANKRSPKSNSNPDTSALGGLMDGVSSFIDSLFEEKPAAKKPEATKKPAAAKKPEATKKPAAAKKPEATKKPAAAKKPPAVREPGSPKGSRDKKSSILFSPVEDDDDIEDVPL